MKQGRCLRSGWMLAVTGRVMFRWRLMVENSREAGHVFLQPDPVVAATAFHDGLATATRDVIDYERALVPAFNPGSFRYE